MVKARVFVGFGVDPITQAIYAIGIGESKETCKEHQAEFEKNGKGQEATYFNIIKLDEEFAVKFRDWLVNCGVPTSEAEEAVREYGRETLKLMEEMEK